MLTPNVVKLCPHAIEKDCTIQKDRPRRFLRDHNQQFIETGDSTGNHPFPTTDFIWPLTTLGTDFQRDPHRQATDKKKDLQMRRCAHILPANHSWVSLRSKSPLVIWFSADSWLPALNLTRVDSDSRGGEQRGGGSVEDWCLRCGGGEVQKGREEVTGEGRRDAKGRVAKADGSSGWHVNPRPPGGLDLAFPRFS